MTLERATRVLREAVGDGGDVTAAPSDRDETIAKIAAALEARSRHRRRRRVVGVISAAACFTLLGAGILAHRENAKHEVAGTELGQVNDAKGVTAVRGGVAETINAGTRVVEGTELRTPESAEAHLTFDTGTRVTLGGGTRVRLVEQTKRKRFAVEAGSLDAKVNKLAADERFVVTTPDAEVEVHGTAFRVSVVPPDPSCEDGTPTRLVVTEGVVVLRHRGVETRVAAGEHWPICDVLPVVESPATSAAPPASTPRPRVIPTSTGAVDEPVPTTAPPSSLSEQNDLFDLAMRDKHAGRSVEALASLDRLLAKYPHGPLAESASIERIRLLDGTARARAARDYLAQWPNGVGRAEAEAAARATPAP